jgi:hypothetical protein
MLLNLSPENLKAFYRQIGVRTHAEKFSFSSVVYCSMTLNLRNGRFQHGTSVAEVFAKLSNMRGAFSRVSSDAYAQFIAGNEDKYTGECPSNFECPEQLREFLMQATQCVLSKNPTSSTLLFVLEWLYKHAAHVGLESAFPRGFCIDSWNYEDFSPGINSVKAVLEASGLTPIDDSLEASADGFSKTRLTKFLTKHFPIRPTAEAEPSVTGVASSQLICVHGGPGTGKSTYVRSLIENLVPRKKILIVVENHGDGDTHEVALKKLGMRVHHIRGKHGNLCENMIVSFGDDCLWEDDFHVYIMNHQSFTKRFSNIPFQSLVLVHEEQHLPAVQGLYADMFSKSSMSFEDMCRSFDKTIFTSAVPIPWCDKNVQMQHVSANAVSSEEIMIPGRSYVKATIDYLTAEVVRKHPCVYIRIVTGAARRRLLAYTHSIEPDRDVFVLMRGVFYSSKYVNRRPHLTALSSPVLDVSKNKCFVIADNSAPTGINIIGHKGVALAVITEVEKTVVYGDKPEGSSVTNPSFLHSECFYRTSPDDSMQSANRVRGKYHRVNLVPVDSKDIPLSFDPPRSYPPIMHHPMSDSFNEAATHFRSFDRHLFFFLTMVTHFYCDSTNIVSHVNKVRIFAPFLRLVACHATSPVEFENTWNGLCSRSGTMRTLLTGFSGDVSNNYRGMQVISLPTIDNTAMMSAISRTVSMFAAADTDPNGARQGHCVMGRATPTGGHIADRIVRVSPAGTFQYHNKDGVAVTRKGSPILSFPELDPVTFRPFSYTENAVQQTTDLLMSRVLRAVVIT